MRVICPSCGAENTAEQPGQQVVCSSCFEIFDAPAQGASAAPVQPPRQAAPDPFAAPQAPAPQAPAPQAPAPQAPAPQAPAPQAPAPQAPAPQAPAAQASSGDRRPRSKRPRSARIQKHLDRGKQDGISTMHERSTGGYRNRAGKQYDAENVFGNESQARSRQNVERRSRSDRAPLGDTSPNSGSGRADRRGQRRPVGTRPDSRSAGGQRTVENVGAGDAFASPPTQQPRAENRVQTSSRPAQADPFGGSNETADPFGSPSAPSQPADPFATGPDDPFATGPNDPFASSNPFETPADSQPETQNLFADPSPEAEDDPFGIVGGASGASSNPFDGASDAAGADQDDPFAEESWNPFGGEEPQGADDPFGGTDLFKDDVAEEAANLLSEAEIEDAEEEPMVLDVSGLNLSDTGDDELAGEALFELDLPEPDDAGQAPKRRRRRKGKGKRKPKGKRGSKASKAAKRKKAKKKQRQRLMLILLLVIGLGASMHLTEMGAFGINILMPDETKSTPPRMKRRSKSELAKLRSAKADGPQDHMDRIKELKDEWKKDQKNKIVIADLAQALITFEERYPEVYIAQQKLVSKVAKAVIKPETFKEHGLGIRKFITNKKYPAALKALKAVTDAPEYDVTADDNYLRARIARLMNDNRNAIKFYTKAINEIPDYEAAAYDLGRIYLDLKQYAKAKELFQEQIKNINHAGARVGMAIVELSVKKTKESISSDTETLLNDALAISRKVGAKGIQFEVHTVRAGLYERLGKVAQQEEDLKMVLSLKPGHEPSAIALAEIYQKKGQGPDVLKVLKTCKKNGCKSSRFIAFYVQKLYEVEQPREARAELDAGLELYSKDRRLLELKAEKEYQAKNLLNAIQLYEKLKENHPTYETSYLRLAELLDEDGKAEDAVRVLESGIDSVHDKMSLMEKAARFHAKKGNNQKAKEYFEKILKQDPTRADLKLRFAVLLKELGNQKDAYKYFKELDESNSLSPKQQIVYAEVLHALGRLKEALEVLDCEGKSLDTKRNAASEIRCGALRTSQGQFDKAEGHLQKALALESSDRAYYHLGMNALARRSYELAAENLKRAVFLNKKALDAKIGLARALRKLGGTDNLQKAKINLAGVIDIYSRYRTVLEKNSRDPNAYLERGILYLQGNDAQRAIDDFNQGLSLNPDHPELIVSKAKALYYARQTKKATDLLKKLIKKQPKNASAHFYLGRMYNASGLTSQSAKHFESSLKYGEKDKSFSQIHEAHASLANLYKEMKQTGKACTHMKAYLSTAPENVSDRFDVADDVRKNCR